MLKLARISGQVFSNGSAHPEKKCGSLVFKVGAIQNRKVGEVDPPMGGERRRGLAADQSASDAHLDMQAGGSDHIDQGIEAKQFDLAAHEVRDTRLRHAKELGGLRLA